MLFVVCKQLIFNHKEVWVALAANLPHFGVFTLRWWLDLYLIFLICCKTMLQQCSCFLTACLEPPCQSPSSQGCVHCILLSSIVSPFCLNRKCLLACFIGYQQLNVWVSLLWQEVMFAAVSHSLSYNKTSHCPESVQGAMSSALQWMKNERLFR